jgi:hypothetical protein
VSAASDHGKTRIRIERMRLRRPEAGRAERAQPGEARRALESERR